MHNDFSIDIEWARITPEKVLVAAANRAWLHRPETKDDPFVQPMRNKGNATTTRNLLDGAIAAGKITVSSSKIAPTMTRTRLIWRLAGAYHLNHCTPEHMKEAAHRFATAGHTRLAEWAEQKAIEEQGHDQLALLDIQSLGYDAEGVVKVLVPPAAKTMVNYFTQKVYSPDPIDCVGYSYTMERLAICISEEYIQAVQALLPLGANATRCLRVHSSVGYEVEHVQETVEMVAVLTPKERTRVAATCYETALLCFTPPKEGYISDEELQHILKPMQLRKDVYDQHLILSC